MQEHKTPERNIANYFVRTGRYVETLSLRHVAATRLPTGTGTQTS
jgi:hypothetical protein